MLLLSPSFLESELSVLHIYRVLGLLMKAMEKRSEDNFSVDSLNVLGDFLGKVASWLGRLRLLYMCACLNAFCSYAGDDSQFSFWPECNSGG